MADLDDIKDGKDFHTDAPQRNTPFTLKDAARLTGDAVPTVAHF